MTFTSGGVTVDNLSFNDNTISSSSNADIRLTPGGTGSVIVNSLTIDDNINITDNEIKTTQSNSDLVIAPAGTGSAVISKADINGGTIDKYIGDSIMIFFGDPTTKGAEEDAKLCVEMAVEMLEKMDDLKGTWGKNFSLRKDLEIRIGINTGYCTVGNFGSNERLDYTAVGGTVNLASRLESVANSGSICISEETYLLVNPFFKFHKLSLIHI